MKKIKFKDIKKRDYLFLSGILSKKRGWVIKTKNISSEEIGFWWWYVGSNIKGTNISDNLKTNGFNRDFPRTRFKKDFKIYKMSKKEIKEFEEKLMFEELGK